MGGLSWDDDKKKDGGTGTGTSSGTASRRVSSGVSTAEQKARARSKRDALNWYKARLGDWGVKRTTAINKLINRLASGEYDSGVRLEKGQFQRRVIQVSPRAWLTSTTGKQRINVATQNLTTLLGEDYATALKDKAIIKAVQTYAKSLNPDVEAFSQAILATTRGKTEFANLAGFTGAGLVTGQTLAQQMQTYKVYEKALNDELTRAGIAPAADASIFFRSGVSEQDFTNRIGEYITNRGAFATVLGRQMTEAERQAALYAPTGEAQRTALTRAAAAAPAFSVANIDAFTRLLGRAPTAEERQNIIYGDTMAAQRTLGALGRAGEVAGNVRQTEEALRWQTGGGLTQAQKESMVYATPAGEQAYDALKSAFSLKRAFNKGTVGGFGMTRTAAGQVVMQGI